MPKPGNHKSNMTAPSRKGHAPVGMKKPVKMDKHDNIQGRKSGCA